jgi:hypothetical protein
MKLTTLLTIAAAGLLTAAGSPQTFTGVVTDTMCGAKHGMMKGQPDDECARMCVKGSRDYALYDGKTVWKLSDQKTPAKFAAKKVEVTGVANEQNKTIKVTSIAAAQ